MKGQCGIYKIESICKPSRIYIGSTINYRIRKGVHINQLLNNEHHSKKLQRHVNKYGIDDLVFIFIVSCDRSNLLEQEQFFIDSFIPYFNICPKAGCPAQSSMNIKTRVKISRALKGKHKKPFTQEHLMNMSKAQKGIIRKKGFKHSEETKQKISAFFKGRKCSEEHNRKKSLARLGVKRGPMSEEQKKKISDAHKGKQGFWIGKKLSEEHREKLRISHLGNTSRKDFINNNQTTISCLQTLTH